MIDKRYCDIRIRFNKTRGMPGRGSLDHVWRVFQELPDGTDKEYVCKEVTINTRSWSAKEKGGDEWNICCRGYIEVIKEESKIIIYDVDEYGCI
jgi:hypothetical protein